MERKFNLLLSMQGSNFRATQSSGFESAVPSLGPWSFPSGLFVHHAYGIEKIVFFLNCSFSNAEVFVLLSFILKKFIFVH
jgi:hypothetical protein